MENKITRENISGHLIDKQLSLIGKTRVDTLDVEEWWDKWTMTEAQEKEFRTFAIPLIKKVFKCNKTRAENCFGWFWLTIRLKIKN